MVRIANPLAFWAQREFAGRTYQPAHERLAADLFAPGITPCPSDVVVANAASKSTLRAVADDFVAGHADADSFPSFELVQHSNQDVVRKADRSHVTMATSRAIIDLFARHYVPWQLRVDFILSGRVIGPASLRDASEPYLGVLVPQWPVPASASNLRL